MKFIIVCMTLIAAILTLAGPQQRTEFDCVVTNVQRKLFTIKCDSPNPNVFCMLPKNKQDEECKRTILDIPAENWNEFQSWHYETNNDPWHPPVKQLRPKQGQLLKASRVMGAFVPLKPCAVRGYEAIIAYKKARGYDRAPFTLATPEGCGQEPSAYIKEIQNKKN